MFDCEIVAAWEPVVSSSERGHVDERNVVVASSLEIFNPKTELIVSGIVCVELDNDNDNDDEMTSSLDIWASHGSTKHSFIIVYLTESTAMKPELL